MSGCWLKNAEDPAWECTNVPRRRSWAESSWRRGLSQQTENLEEEKPRRGSSFTEANPFRKATDSSMEQSPEGGATFLAQSAQVGCRERGITARGQRPLKGGAAVLKGKPLEGESWTWLRGEINLQSQRRSKPSRAWETPRTELSELGKLANVDSEGWCRDEEQTPWKELDTERCRAGANRRTLKERRSSREDEPATQVTGDGDKRNTIGN